MACAGIPHAQSLYALGVAFAAYGVAVALPPAGNGFIAVFVCAITLGILRPDIRDNFEERAEDIVEIVKLGIFVVFGAVLTLDGLFTDGWAAVGIVVVTLLVARPVAIWIALAGTGLGADLKGFMAWFGPKGVATMAFSLLVIAEGRARRRPDRQHRRALRAGLDPRPRADRPPGGGVAGAAGGGPRGSARRWRFAGWLGGRSGGLTQRVRREAGVDGAAMDRFPGGGNVTRKTCFRPRVTRCTSTGVSQRHTRAKSAHACDVDPLPRPDLPLNDRRTRGSRRRAAQAVARSVSSPCRCATAAASVRDRTSSLERIRETWTLAVFSAM